MKEKLNDFDYEQIVLGEKNVDEDYLDREKISKIKESDEEILRQYPPDEIAASIRSKISRESKIVKFPVKAVFIPLSAVAVLLLFFTIFPYSGWLPASKGNSNPEVIRLKGNKPSMFIYKEKSNQSSELLGNNSIVHENDLLQIGYDSAGAKYGVIFSIDGRGTVTLHFPENIYSNTRLDYGGKVFLPFSYELDNAPFFERFFFVTSDHEIDAAVIMEKAGRIAKGNKSEMLNLPVDQNQQSIILFKEEVR